MGPEWGDPRRALARGPLGARPGGKLALNVLRFARILRAAGLSIGPARVHFALDAIGVIGPARRADFYWALHACFVKSAADRPIFDQAFHMFWRDPKLLERAMALMLPELEREVPEPEGEKLRRRLADAMAAMRGQGAERRDAPPEIEIDARATFSAREVLGAKDFEQMSAAELEAAKRALRALELPDCETRTRRTRPCSTGDRIDLRRSLRRALRAPGAPLVRKTPRARPLPLVILADVSGSMSGYSRMLLHFAHGLARSRERVHSFVFGTRLTNITRALRHKDVDEALAKVGELVEDWSGGTRLGHAIAEFNRLWSRRVLGQGAIVLLITDGLDREAGAGLEPAIERLAKSCRRLIWLNPLMRFDGYRPLAGGAAAMIDHVDEMRAAHSLDSLEDLARVLSEKSAPRPLAGAARAAQGRRGAEP